MWIAIGGAPKPSFEGQGVHIFKTGAGREDKVDRYLRQATQFRAGAIGGIVTCIEGRVQRTARFSTTYHSGYVYLKSSYGG